MSKRKKLEHYPYKSTAPFSQTELDVALTFALPLERVKRIARMEKETSLLYSVLTAKEQDEERRTHKFFVAVGEQMSTNYNLFNRCANAYVEEHGALQFERIETFLSRLTDEVTSAVLYDWLQEEDMTVSGFFQALRLYKNGIHYDRFASLIERDDVVYEAFEDEITQLQSSQRAQVETKVQLLANIERLIDEYNEASSEDMIEEAAHQVEEMTEALQQVERERQEALQHAKKEAQHVKKLQRELEKVKRNEKKWSAQLDEARQQVGERNQELGTLRTTVGEQEGTIERLQRALEREQTVQQQTEQRVRTQMEREWNVEFARKTDRLEMQFEEERREYEREYAQLKQQYDELVAQADNDEALAIQIDDQERRTVELERERDQLLQTLTLERERVDELTRQLAHVQLELKTLREEGATPTADVVAIERDVLQQFGMANANATPSSEEVALPTFDEEDDDDFDFFTVENKPQ